MSVTTNGRISFVVGARPNFMKAAPVLSALEGRVDVELVHTGQHYDQAMSDSFFRDLDLPAPDVHLGVGSATHGAQTARVLSMYEEHLLQARPDAVVVVGDVNSTLAAALAAAKLNIPVAHIEAGLRSFDRRMPEEINRVLTDQISRWLLTPSPDADANLLREGVPDEWIHRVGNVMIDTLLTSLPDARQAFPALRADLELPTNYGVVTLHRPSNVDDPGTFHSIITALAKISEDLPLIFPVHPRTRAAIERQEGELGSGVIYCEPLGYLHFVALMAHSDLVFTDSGGVQEETSVLGVPCLTLREHTERPITVELGTNEVVGTDRNSIVEAAERVQGRRAETVAIPLWDGHAGARVADVLVDALSNE